VNSVTVTPGTWPIQWMVVSVQVVATPILSPLRHHSNLQRCRFSPHRNFYVFYQTQIFATKLFDKIAGAKGRGTSLRTEGRRNPSLPSSAALWKLASITNYAPPASRKVRYPRCC
jgi:hypothetical protein